MQKNSDNFSMQDAMRLAKTPAGQQLLAFIQKQNPTQLNKAMTQAAAGDYSSVKNTMAEILSNPQIQEMLRKIQEAQNG